VPRPEHTLKQLDDDYDKWKTYRELEALHDRLNEVLVDESVVNLATNLKTDYVAGDLDTEAEIIVAVNATNSRVNEIAVSLNAVLEKIRVTPR
jgi:hypothetical protein